MRSIAEWADWASVLSSPMKLTSSASFSPSIRISLRLKIHQAQAKNFCRVLDIRVAKVVETDFFQAVIFQRDLKMLGDEVWLHKLAHRIDIDVIQVLLAIGCSTHLLIDQLLLSEPVQ